MVTLHPWDFGWYCLYLALSQAFHLIRKFRSVKHLKTLTNHIKNSTAALKFYSLQLCFHFGNKLRKAIHVLGKLLLNPIIC